MVERPIPRDCPGRYDVHYVDNQGLCHSCGILLDRYTWEAYAGEGAPAPSDDPDWEPMREGSVNVVDEQPEHHDQLENPNPGKLDSQDTNFPAREIEDDPYAADPTSDERLIEGERGHNLVDLTERQTNVPNKANPYRDWGESYSSWNQYEDPMDKMGMAMLTPEDLPDDWYIEVSEDEGEAHIKLLDAYDNLQADLVVDTESGEVSHSNARRARGWGPLLYEVAMEFITERGGALSSDWRTVSDDAARVWDRFHQREDIDRAPLDRPPPHSEGLEGDERAEESLQYMYTKDRERLDELEEQGQIRYARSEGRQPTVAVDLDGTLLGPVEYGAPSTPSGQPALSPPNKGAAGAMETFHELGWRILIFTARFGYEGPNRQDPELMRDEIIHHLQQHGIEFDEVWVGPKPVADAYIDDLAVPFKGDWYEVVREVTMQKTEEQGMADYAPENEKEAVTLIDTVDNPNDWINPTESRRDLSVDPRKPGSYGN